MLKKLIAYQKLLLNSIPPFDTIPPSIFTVFLYCFAFAMVIFINLSIFWGNTISSNTLLPFTLPIISVWMINRLLHGNHKLFETVPVSRIYTMLNVFLLSVVITFILYILACISGMVLIYTVFIILYLMGAKGGNQSPPESAAYQIIDTTKGNMLMLCILVIILFAGVAITFIKSKKLRLSSFIGFTAIGYGLLLFLKLNMPLLPISDKVEFLESFSVMPQGNTILISVAITTVIISVTSIFMVYNLYVSKSNVRKYH